MNIKQVKLLEELISLLETPGGAYRMNAQDDIQEEEPDIGYNDLQKLCQKMLEVISQAKNQTDNDSRKLIMGQFEDLLSATVDTYKRTFKG